MIIRKAEQKDAASLYALEQKLFSAENFPLSRGSFAYHIRNNMLYVAEIDNNIAGYVLVLIKRANAKLYSIGVGEPYRGRKIAKKLLELVSRELVFLGFKRLLLEVRIDNSAAISLYKKLGFNIVKNLKAFYLDGCDAYLMELDIAQFKVNL
ncbi:MAG: ribosomal protein S18-alanine N-acetyltransferase [Sulfurimonas sp.]|uniref:ribosomal protein S18-alanine N-acetyltransferase n=1 Tax=Sulfurimonas sp. TaxID=2022749 RepID=UPI002603C0EB|nr:ribosomal protein S18-alanine N-acetyltransferase [Sulfurimonas sp.]MDD5401069.1 ribosomal protein S18-alanine N-acetyltransferase [Sulfurimonas sp.]